MRALQVSKVETSGRVGVILARAATGRLVGLPKSLGNIQNMIHPAAPDKESVAQSVEVANGLGGYRLGGAKADEQTLGPAADGSAYVQIRIEPCRAWQNKRTQGRQFEVRFIHFPLELLNLCGRGSRLALVNILGQSGQNRAQIKEFVLDSLENA